MLIDLRRFTIEELEREHKRFKEAEGKISFYNMSRNLVQQGFNLEGSLLLLATWNTARFRVANQAKLAYSLKEALDSVSSSFVLLSNKTIQDIDLENDKDRIKKIYTDFRKIKGIEYTGASKIMSLHNPRLFVMWDSYIRGEYYLGDTSEEYLRFMRMMQEAVKDINWQRKEPLAKIIDEYNYMTISVPKIQEARRKNASKKKEY